MGKSKRKRQKRRRRRAFLLVPVVIAIAVEWTRLTDEVGVVKGELEMLRERVGPKALEMLREEMTRSIRGELKDEVKSRIKDEIDEALKKIRADVEALQKEAQAQSASGTGSVSIEELQSQQQVLCRRDQQKSVHRLPAGTILPSEMPPDRFLSGDREQIWRLANGDLAPSQTDYAELVAGGRDGENEVRLPDLRGMNLRGRQLHYYVKLC